MLTSHLGAASGYDVPRLSIGFTTVRMKLNAKVGDAAELARLASNIDAIGSQVGEVEQFLRLPPSGLTDLRAGVAEPDPARLGQLRAALEPSSAGGAGAPPVVWDGEVADAVVAKKNKAALKTALLSGLKAHPKAVMPGIRRTAKAPSSRWRRSREPGRKPSGSSTRWSRRARQRR